MPHERDESATENADGGKAPTQAEVIGQAHSDLAHGLQDTDCRSVPRKGLQQGEDACPGGSGSKDSKDHSWHGKDH